MYEFRVNDKIYKIKFGYGVLYTSDLIDRVMSVIVGGEETDPAKAIKNVMGITAELLLEGLQKRHKDEFGYDGETERKEMLLKVCDMIDDFEDEHTDADGNRDADGFTLFNDLQEELVKNGFLSQLMNGVPDEAVEQKATVIPQDHQRKAGRKK